jgi:hypothetical protein
MAVTAACWKLFSRAMSARSSDQDGMAFVLKFETACCRFELRIHGMGTL